MKLISVGFKLIIDQRKLMMMRLKMLMVGSIYISVAADDIFSGTKNSFSLTVNFYF